VSVRAQVKARFDVVREMGDELIVACPHPDHDDHNPSAAINVRKRLWVCYACGRGGSLEALMGGRVADEQVEDMLADLQRSLTPEPSRTTYPERWLDQFDAGPVHPYWLGRGLSEAVCRRFRLGYDVGRRMVTYPLRTPSGAVLGVVHRAVNPRQFPRYQYPPQAPISETLFGYYLVREGVRDVVLVEGALDAIAMWDVGVPAVAQMGARLSRTQVELLRGLGLSTLTIAYDQDRAGEEAFRRAMTNPLLNFSLLRVMSWSPQAGKDPLDLGLEQRLAAYEKAELVMGGR
jgi:DNA primase